MSRSVAFCDLVLDERLQARETQSHGAVEDYAEVYASGGTLPPIDVFDVGGALYVVDGFHRVAAAASTGQSFMRVDVVGAGAIEEAIWHASGANTKHGIRRTRADKRRSVWLALESIGSELSTSVIADHVGVSRELVRTMRNEWEAKQLPVTGNSDTDEQLPVTGTSDTSEADQLRQSRTSEPQTRKGRDGKSYPVASAKPEAPAPSTAKPMPDVEPLYMAVIKAVQEARRASVPIRAIDASLGERVKALLHEAEHAIRYRIPAVCPKCGGVGCVACSSRGWMSTGESEKHR